MRKFLLLLTLGVCCCWEIMAQNRTITGKVTATADGSPLPGVSVLVKGTNVGTTTNNDGNYQIPTPNNATLVFSFIGYTTKEVSVGSQTTVNMTMTEDAKQLSEVVVTALGIQKNAKSIGYAVSDLKNEQLNVARNTNIVNALSGKVAGVRVAGSNGMTGSGSAIFIRGLTTFTASNQPLFVVDGIPIDNGGPGATTNTAGQPTNQTQRGVSQSNRGLDINQDDIESMSILKGPAAAALYGSRAASGAIIITTKRGKVNGSRGASVSYSGSYNVVEVNRWPEYQNEFAQGTMMTNATTAASAATFQPNADQSNWGPKIAGQMVPSAYSAADRALFGLPDQVPLTAYPNNVKDMFRKGMNMQHNLAFSGATEKSSYYFSYGFLREKGFMEANELWRHSFTLNANTQVSKRLNIGTNVQYISNNSDRSQINNQLSNPLFRGWFTPRNVDLKGSPWVRPDGTQVFYNAVTDNPFWSYRNNLYNDSRQRVIGNVNLNYEFNDWLSANYKIGTDYLSEFRQTADGIGARGQANHNAQQAGAVGERNIRRQEISSYFNLVAKKNLNEDFSLNLLLGNEVNMRKGTDTGILGFGLVTPGYYNIANASTLQQYPSYGIDGVYNYTEQRLVGVYGDFQASYRNWANLNITGRNDWSSTFRRGNNSYFYPSVAGSVVLTDAISSLKDNRVINFAKIRANWAKVGREAPVYSTDTYYSLAAPSDGWNTQINFPFQNVQGRTLNDIAGNPDLGPEFTTSKEISLETRFLNNKIAFEITRFWQKSTNIILNVPIASATGFTQQTLNSGEMEANGWEWNLTVTPVKTAAMQWDVTFNGSRIRNNVLSLAPGVQNISIGGFNSAQNRIEAGQPYGVIYANSLLRNDAGQLIIDNNGLPINDTRGAVKRGDPNPNWTGGVINNLSYKGFNLNFLIDIRRGGDFLSRVIGDLYRTGTVVETTSKPRFDDNGVPLRNWLIEGVRQSDGQPNATAITAQQYWSNLYNFNSPGEYVFDASWVRLREASLFYSVPKSVLSKTPFSKLDIGLNGRNLWLRTKVPHIDPEVNLTGAGNSQGIEFNSAPQARTYGVVLKAVF